MEPNSSNGIARSNERPTIEKLECMLCKACIWFTGIPAERYEDHLIREHNVMNSLQFIVDTTLISQGKMHGKDCAVQTETISINEECEEESEFAPKCKKSKIEDVTILDQKIKLKELKVELAQIEVKPEHLCHVVPRVWYEGAEFQCRMCHQTFYSGSKLAGHIKDLHGTGLKEYFKQHGKLCTKNVEYSCKVCNKNVRHQESDIRSHLEESHYLSLEQYEVTFHNVEIKQEECEEDEEEGVDLDEEEEVMLEETFSGDDYSDWCNGCTYMCRICDTGNIETFSHMKTHLKREHRLSIPEYKEKHNQNIYDRFKSHNCLFCGKGVAQNPECLNRHIKIHGISVKSYFNRFVVGNEKPKTPIKATKTNDDADDKYRKWKEACTYFCKICNLGDISSFPGFQTHLKRDHGVSNINDYKKEHGEDIYGSVQEHLCALCGKSVVQTSNKLSSHFHASHNNMALRDYYERCIVRDVVPSQDQVTTMRENAEYSNWMNGTSYQCKECGKKGIRTTNMFKTHLKKTHNWEIKDYQQKVGIAYTRSYDELRYHECVICGTNLIQSWGVIQRHLTNHEISPRSYFTRFIIRKEVPNANEFKKISSLSTAAQSLATEWANKCKFKCKVRDCASPPFLSLDGFKKHLLKTHHFKSLQDYRNKFGRKFFSSIKKHDCVLCETTIIMTAGRIRQHLGDHHQMSLGQYYDKFIVGGGSNKAEVQVIKTSKSCCVSNGESVVDLQPNSDPEFDEWKNKCVWQCKNCDFTTRSPFGINPHMNQKHKDRDNRDMDYLPHFHHCLICGSQVAQNHKELMGHCRKSHQIQLYNYYKKYVMLETDDAATDDAKEEVKAVKVEPNYYYKPIQFDQQFYDWQDQCQWTCKICPYSSTLYVSLRTHLRKKHKRIVQPNNEKYLTVSKVYHKCLVCEDQVEHNREQLKEHLKVHDISITDYYYKQVKKDEIVMPEVQIKTEVIA